MRYFPLFIDFSTQHTVIVYGGGENALRKVRLLLKTDVQLHIVADELIQDLHGLVTKSRIHWLAQSFDDRQISARVAAVFAADDDETNERASQLARRLGIPVNVVDRADLSTFIVPAIVDRDPLVVAIGTEGAGPVFAQGLRARIESLLPPRIGGLLSRAAELRSTVAATVPEGAPRRAFWHTFFFGTLRDGFLTDETERFERDVAGALSNPEKGPQSGRIDLLEACSDAELLTLKAHRLLQEADMIVLDGSVSAQVLEYARRDAERRTVHSSIWSVGDNEHRRTARRLLEAALSGQRVVRLYDASASAIDTELAALRATVPAHVSLGAIRSMHDDCNWAPLFGNDNANGTDTWRLAS